MKVYKRDKKKVMRSIPGISSHGNSIFIENSVYTLTRVDSTTWMFTEVKR